MIKCISIKQPHAENIRSGKKIYEIRGWTTTYRGYLIVAATKRNPGFEDLRNGSLVCLVELIDIVPFSKSLEKKACVTIKDCKKKMKNKLYAWELRLVKELPDLKIKGQLGLYTAPANILKSISISSN